MPKKILVKRKIKTIPVKAVKQNYILRLFITGILPNSVRAVVNIKAICEQHLKGRYELEIIDIYQQPSFTLSENIIAVPVLIKKFPLPEGRVIGDLSDATLVLKELNLV
jgi:circadian clock protein KaiB